MASGYDQVVSSQPGGGMHGCLLQTLSAGSLVSICTFIPNIPALADFAHG